MNRKSLTMTCITALVAALIGPLPIHADNCVDTLSNTRYSWNGQGADGPDGTQILFECVLDADCVDP